MTATRISSSKTEVDEVDLSYRTIKDLEEGMGINDMSSHLTTTTRISSSKTETPARAVRRRGALE
jgi:hypothetical protein